MIDFITLTKPNISEVERWQIINTNDLQTNSKDGVIYYDNLKTKNMVQQKGVFIRIETDNKLKVECSLHKFFSEISGNGRTNYDLFTMEQARGAICELLKEKGINADSLRVYNYEIGVNLPMNKDCRCYLDKMRTIGIIGEEKKLIQNQKYKDERIRTTLFHRDVRKYFKVYDKVFEMRDRKLKYTPPTENILRIETVNRRVERKTVETFFTEKNLKNLMELFFRDWRTVQFEKEIIVPKGTNYIKRKLCTEILEKGVKTVLKEAKEERLKGQLTERSFRTIREFITNDWDSFKTQILVEQSPEEKEYRERIKTAFILSK